jgi:hypothetical protein
VETTSARKFEITYHGDFEYFLKFNDAKPMWHQGRGGDVSIPLLGTDEALPPFRRELLMLLLLIQLTPSIQTMSNVN